MSSQRSLWSAVGPGLLVAATGVGAGDIVTAAFAGGHLGLRCLWAVLLGAFLKFVLTEGLARWQLASGTTLLEGAVEHLGLPVRVFFPLYLLPWSFFVGAALMGACGAAAHALFPAFEDAERGKLVFGLAHSAAGLLVALFGGFRLFERVMKVCTFLMFTTVVATAALLRPAPGEVLLGVLVPRISDAAGQGADWTLALMGGIGGTLTVLCYGYWIREKGRAGLGELAATRVDLGVAYLVTAIFGLSMVVIGSNVPVEGRGTAILAQLGQRLGDEVGAPARWAFLIGAWATAFTSLLGVWQSVPYLFADFAQLAIGASRDVDTRGWLYRGYLIGIATVPALGLFHSFARVQKIYAILGASFLPLLALALLLLNGRSSKTGLGAARNRPATTAILLFTLVFFAAFGWWEVRS